MVSSNDLQPDIVNASTPSGAALVRARFEQAMIPPQVERAILDAYRRMGKGSVAVRSSATAEDLPEAAFAGQQETFLGVSGEAALLDAVRRCWASLWSDRAISYREQHGLAQVPVKLAVIVQRMVAADVAGVMFTANPVTGARDETIVEASGGLGEALVSGLVTPDHFVLRNTRHRWQIVERQPGRREVEVRPRAGGGVEQVAGGTASVPALPDAVLLQLARMGASIARHFGRPQDIEWAWADGKLWVLQSRPITALPEPPTRRNRFDPSRFAGDYLQVRPYPLDMTTWVPALGNALPRMLPVGGLIPSLARMWVEQDGVVERLADFPGIRPTPELLLAPARILALARRYDPANWREDPILAASLTRVHELESLDLRALSWSQLLDTAREAMAMPLAIMEIRRRYFPRGALALAALWLTLKFLGLDGPLRSPALRRRQPHARGEPRAGGAGGGDSDRPCPGGAVRKSGCGAAPHRTATGAGRPRVSRAVRGLSRCLRPPRDRLTVAGIGTDLERLAADCPEHSQRDGAGGTSPPLRPSILDDGA